MIQSPAFAGRKFILFALFATLLVWSLIGLDLWLVERQADSVSLLAEDLSLSSVATWKAVLIGLGFLLTLSMIHACRQIFLRSRQGEALLAMQRRLVDHTSEAMMVTDGAQRIVSVNAAFELITGYCAADVVGRTPTMLSAGHHGLAMHRTIWDQVAENGFWEGEVWDRRKDGTIYPKLMRIAAISEAGAPTSHFVAVFTDISEQKAQTERFDYLARHDPLTNLPNRLALDSHLHAVLDGAVPGIDRLALLIIDLDNFKTINDSLGHHAGDRLLAETARRLSAHMGKSRHLFRLGGDEFVVVIDHLVNEAAVVDLVQGMVRSMGEAYEIDGHAWHSTPSIGISLYPEDGRDGQALIRNADTAMYYAKASGRNNYQFLPSR